MFRLGRVDTSALTFWSLCVAVGVIVALIVVILR